MLQPKELLLTTTSYNFIKNIQFRSQCGLRKYPESTECSQTLKLFLLRLHSCTKFLLDEQFFLPILSCQPIVFSVCMFEHFHQVQSSQKSAMLHYIPKQTVTRGLIKACFQLAYQVFNRFSEHKVLKSAHQARRLKFLL